MCYDIHTGTSPSSHFSDSTSHRLSCLKADKNWVVRSYILVPPPILNVGFVAACRVVDPPRSWINRTRFSPLVSPPLYMGASSSRPRPSDFEWSSSPMRSSPGSRLRTATSPAASGFACNTSTLPGFSSRNVCRYIDKPNNKKLQTIHSANDKR